MSEPCDLGLVEAADAVARREVTSAALLESCLARLDAVNPKINAAIWVDREGARAAAAAADAALASGTRASGTRANGTQAGGALAGKLFGVPLAHKDMYYQAGKPCTCGSAIRRDFVPDYTCTVVERLGAAGAYSFAGLNMAEFAQNPTGHNRAFGHCHNPWGLDHITGGSSSGSGALVASGGTFASLGSDTGGSIRLPASACGVTGIKPTQTRVSRYGVMPLSFSADNVGPLARSARDCARVLSVIAGHDPRDPTSAANPVPDYEAALDGDLRGQRIGVPTNAFVLGADPAVLAAFEAALAVLAARGASIVRLELPLMPAIAAYGGVVSRVEGATIHARWMRERPQDYAVHLSGRMYPGFAVPGTYYVEALARRGPILKAFAAEVFAKVDLLATPTIPTALPTLAETDIDAAEASGPAETIARFLAVSVNTRPFNYLGLPAVSLPCGFDGNGLPVGLQLAGRPFAEARVLKVADGYQRETDWHRRKPAGI
ncbi:MAG: glutamyl-tRNA amidotransferase [Rhodospirillales bacterium 70-18]|nr:amidase [Rhodospirillales bacterium]OJY74267.1 MAG: glutamyl-tRNA amidotransferase [Rhodospirillales bacterium 70-18]